MATLLDVDALRVDFVGRRTVHAVRGLSYSIGRGETLCLVGESGSGKSASALALLRLLPRRVGRVVSGAARFEDLNLLTASDDELQRVRGARISMVFQDPLSSLNPVIRIGDQITEQLETHAGLGPGAAKRRTIELLAEVGIPDAKGRVDDYPHQFSGGMRQRAMIAMAISCHPALLIADEPTTSLDVTIQAQIVELLRRLREEFGMAILLITHDLGIAAGLADRIAVMYAGRIVELGSAEAILADPSHPYTLGLLQSVPRLDRPRTAQLSPVIGSPPDLAAELRGCPFRPRCPYAVERCAIDDPPLLQVGPDKAAACWQPQSGSLRV